MYNCYNSKKQQQCQTKCSPFQESPYGTKPAMSQKSGSSASGGRYVITDPAGFYPDTGGVYPDPDGFYPDPGGFYPDPDGFYPDPDGFYPDPVSTFEKTGSRSAIVKNRTRNDLRE